MEGEKKPTVVLVMIGMRGKNSLKNKHTLGLEQQ